MHPRKSVRLPTRRGATSGDEWHRHAQVSVTRVVSAVIPTQHLRGNGNKWEFTYVIDSMPDRCLWLRGCVVCYLCDDYNVVLLVLGRRHLLSPWIFPRKQLARGVKGQGARWKPTLPA